MHQPALRPHSPQRRSSHFVGSVRRSVLNNAVTGPDVVQQEIAVRVNHFAAESRWHRERTAIDGCSCRRRGDGADMAYIAADGMEQAGSGNGVWAACQTLIPRRRLAGTHESGEMINVRQTIRSFMVF